jgi:hypothetical protein
MDEAEHYALLGMFLSLWYCHFQLLTVHRTFRLLSRCLALLYSAVRVRSASTFCARTARLFVRDSSRLPAPCPSVWSASGPALPPVSVVADGRPLEDDALRAAALPDVVRGGREYTEDGCPGSTMGTHDLQGYCCQGRRLEVPSSTTTSYISRERNTLDPRTLRSC